MRNVVGIGNPGGEYDGTRHNVGFRVADLVREAIKAPRWEKDTRSNAAVSCAGDVRVVKPLTYVNLTGGTVAALGGAASETLVVCDDVNLAFGKIRLRESGSAGGHHGLESVIGAIGTDAFPRLRIGVGRADMPHDLPEFVLGRFDADEQGKIGIILDNAVQVCLAWARDGYGKALDVLSRLQSQRSEE